MPDDSLPQADLTIHASPQKYMLTPVDHDPFSDAEAFAATLPAGPESHSQTQSGMPEPSLVQKLRDAAKNPENPLVGRFAAALPLALGQMAQEKLQGLASIVTAPGDILAGKLTPDDPRFTDSAIGASQLLGGNAFGAPEGSLGVFGTRGIDPAKKALAQALESAGASDKHIWDTTGLFKGAEGIWRREIPDRQSRFDPEAKTVVNDQSYYKLGSIYQHPELYHHYPELADIATTLTGKGTGGLYDANIKSGFDRPTMLHEIQHAVQDIDGLTFGATSGSPAMQYLASKLNADEAGSGLPLTSAMDIYHRTAGEVEARNVAARSNLSQAQLKINPPWVTQDVPTGQQFLEEKVKQFANSPEPEPGKAESLGQPYPYEWSGNGAEFKTDAGNTYNIKMIKDPASGDANFAFYDSEHGTDLNNSEGRGAIKVMATVAHAIQQKVQSDPDLKSLSFFAKADEDSRVRLYRAMAQRLSGGARVNESRIGQDVKFTIPLQEPSQ